MTPIRFWMNWQRRGVSRKTIEYIIRQRELETPVSMIVAKLKKRREAEKKRGKSSSDFRLSEGSIWNIIYQYRRLIDNQKKE